MDSSSYNKYLAAIKAANDMESSRAKEVLGKIYADMIANYGVSDNDVDYLYRNYFRYSVR
ncbi:MAG: hypothetical protein IKT60_06200 [Clostridia bacterium]|nr:hypothetical protein [Clostridia bacterium]